MEAPLVANSNSVYPHAKCKFGDEHWYIEAYAIMPSQTSGSPGNIVAILSVGYNFTTYVYTYDLSTGSSKFAAIDGLPGPYDPYVGNTIVGNPSTQEVIAVMKNEYSPTINFTFINPNTGTYRYKPLAVTGQYPYPSSMLLDINAQVIYVLVNFDSAYYPHPVVLQTYDAKSGDLLNTFNVTSDSGEELLYLLLDPQTGTLYGIVGLNSNTTFIITIDITKQTTQLVAQIPGVFWSINWAFEPSTSSFYAIYAGQVWVITLDGKKKPFSLVPSDSSYCSLALWALGISSQQIELQPHQVEPEMVYIWSTPYSDATNTNYSMQSLSHTINGNTVASSVNVLTPVQSILGYATAETISCFPGSESFFIEQSNFYGQVLNLISYSTHEVVQQLLLCESSTYDSSMAWNELANATILSSTTGDFWQTSFYEFGNSTNYIPQIMFTLVNVTLPVWTFEPSSQTIFALLNTFGPSAIFSIQYPNGNINWKLDLSAYTVWQWDTYGIVVDSWNQKLYIIICSDEDDCGDGSSSLVEIAYSHKSASIDSITPIGSYEKGLTSFNIVPSQGGLLWSTIDELFFFDILTKQYTNIVSLSPRCAACMFVHDV